MSEFLNKFDFKNIPLIYSIHPRDKLDVAHRLALAGRAVAYNETSVSYQGPLPTSIHAQRGSLEIQFDHGTKPIEVRDTQHGFEVGSLYCTQSF